MSGTLSEHMRIIEAIEAADAKAATEAASDHVRLLGDNLSDFIAAIQDGFLHQRTPLDTLGIDEGESRCRLK